MSKSFKPKGYSSVSPYVMVDGAQQVIDFAKSVFDANQLRRFDQLDGSISHAEVQIDDTVIMLADASAEAPAFPVWLHVYVADVDACYERALSAGGTSVQQPSEKDGIDRRAGVKDPKGNTWWISTQVKK